MVDLTRALRTAAQTGTVEIGFKSARAAVSGKTAKAIVMARNMPPGARDEIKQEANASNVPIIEFEGTNVELGPALGKPFAISTAAIIEPGESEILQAAR